MPEQIPLKDPRFKGKRYEIHLPEGHPGLTQESAEVCAEKIAAVESLMADFENTFSLDELHAITGFASKEDRLNSPRQFALQALTPVFAQLAHLSSQEAVPNEVYLNLEARYQLLKRSVGAITSDSAGVMFDLVVHDR
jgi:hypothetical protein